MVKNIMLAYIIVPIKYIALGRLLSSVSFLHLHSLAYLSSGEVGPPCTLKAVHG